MISLLFSNTITSQKVLGQQTIIDLNLDKLLSRNSTKYISLSCTTEEITLRQELFSNLSVGNLRADIKELRALISVFEQKYNAYNSSATKLETLLIARDFCKTYTQVIKKITGLRDQSVLIRKLIEYAKSKFPLVQEIEHSLENTALAFNTVSQAILTFDGKIKFERTETENGFAKRIKTASESLGFIHDLKTSISLQINNDISEAILRLYPEETASLSVFDEKYESKIDNSFINLINEIDFYIEIYDLTQKAKEHGTAITIPHRSDKKVFCAKDAYDITLILKEERNIIPNDIDFTAEYGTYFLTGANGGGKTTYLRCVAVNLIFALAGCPVFCKSANFYPFTHLYTHFPADERFTENGRLADENNRLSKIFSSLDEDSFVFLNETYTGTDEKKGTALAIQIAEKIKNTGAFLLYITHFHNVAGHSIPLLHAVVSESDNNTRSYKIIKSKEIGMSYAADILQKYGLSESALRERFGDRLDA